MTEIKRYEDEVYAPSSYEFEESEEGTWVKYEDHAAIVAALQEQVRALASEGAQMLRLLTDISENHDEYVNQDEYLYAGVPMDYVSEINSYVSRDVNAQNPFEATDAFIREIRALARAEGIHFAANRLLAAWESGFVDDTPAAAHDISGAILSAVEFLPSAAEGEFKRDYADEVRDRIRAGEQP